MSIPCAGRHAGPKLRAWLERRRLASQLAGWLLLALALVSCGAAVSTADTHVAREELYRSGNFDYDEFFEDVNSLQRGAKGAEPDEKAARKPLADALDVGDAPLDKLLEALQSKAQELSLGKSRVHFSVEGLDDDNHPLAGKAVSVAASSAVRRPVPKDATKLAAAIGQTAQGEGQVWEKYSPMPEKGRRLSARAAELRDAVDKDFQGASKAKRAEVQRELEVAASVSSQIAQTCDQVVARATRFLKDTHEIVQTAANAEPPKPVASSSGKGKQGRSKPPSRGPSNKEPKGAESPKPHTEHAPPAAPDFNP
jgi:hypothetical protein